MTNQNKESPKTLVDKLQAKEGFTFWSNVDTMTDDRGYEFDPKTCLQIHRGYEFRQFPKSNLAILTEVQRITCHKFKDVRVLNEAYDTDGKPIQGIRAVYVKA